VFRSFTLGSLKSACFPDKILTLLFLLLLEQAEKAGVYSFRVLPWHETWKVAMTVKIQYMLRSSGL